TPNRKDQAVLEAMLCDRLSFGRRGLLRVPVANQFNAHELTASADIADEFVTLPQCFEAFFHVRANLTRLGWHILPPTHVHTRHTRSADKRVIRMRMGSRVATADDLVLDLGRRVQGADADAAAKM